jgi:hypothetical protein
MKRFLSKALVVLGVALLGVGVHVRAQVDDYTRALIVLYSAGKTAEFLKGWCDERAPSTKTTTAAALEAWRTKYRFGVVQNELTRVLGAERLATLNTSLEGARTKLFTQLDNGVSDPVKECQDYGPYLDREVNPRTAYPNEMRILDARLPQSSGSQSSSGTASGGQSSSSGSGGARPPAPTPQPSGAQTTRPAQGATVYTVAQIGAVFEGAKRKTGGDNGVKNKAGEAAIRALGNRIVVTGTLNDSGRWLEWRDSRFESRIDVTCDFRNENDGFPGKSGALKPFTVVGTFKEYDVFFEFTDCQILSGTAGLKRSTVDARLGVRRFELPRDMFLVNPGAGLKDNQIYGMFLRSYYAIGVGGAGYIQYEPYLYLKDGTVYNDPYLAPNSFNVALSKKEEPQKWGKWTRKGNTFTILWNESDDGKPDTEDVLPTEPGSNNQRLNGYFESLSGGGNTAFGGNTSIAVYRGFTFKPDGTFTRDGGASATTGNDYTGDSPNVTASSQSATTRGTYKISGYNLELKFADGTVWRRAFSLGGDKKDPTGLIYIGGTYYLKK